MITNDRHTLAFLAAHATGDFPLQTDWLAAEKFDSQRWSEAVPIWYDQALHVIALAIALEVIDSDEKETSD